MSRKLNSSSPPPFKHRKNVISNVENTVLNTVINRNLNYKDTWLKESIKKHR